MKSGYRKGHGIHSPAVYEFVSKVLFSNYANEDLRKSDLLIKELRNNQELVAFTEYGSGSFRLPEKKRKISDIASKAGVRKKFGHLLYRMVSYYCPEEIIETGTSVGVSTFYIAAGMHRESKLYTIEGNEAVQQIAKSTIEKLGKPQMEFISGLFEKELSALLARLSHLQFAFLDGNHSYQATMLYFNQVDRKMEKGIIVLDDIYLNHGMEKAWKEIQQLSNVTIDLYYMGIVLKGEILTPGHYRIRF